MITSSCSLFSELHYDHPSNLMFSLMRMVDLCFPILSSLPSFSFSFKFWSFSLFFYGVFSKLWHCTQMVTGLRFSTVLIHRFSADTNERRILDHFLWFAANQWAIVSYPLLSFLWQVFHSDLIVDLLWSVSYCYSLLSVFRQDLIWYRSTWYVELVDWFQFLATFAEIRRICKPRP